MLFEVKTWYPMILLGLINALFFSFFRSYTQGKTYDIDSWICSSLPQFKERFYCHLLQLVDQNFTGFGIIFVLATFVINYQILSSLYVRYRQKRKLDGIGGLTEQQVMEYMNSSIDQ